MADINQASSKGTYNQKPDNWNNNIPANTPGKKNNSRISDINSLIAAGINPVTGLPLKMGSTGYDGFLKESIKKNLRIIDEQDAVNRYKWYNLPANLTSQELERMLYYKGQLAFFYMEVTNEFYFMPYALDGGLDFYGRFNRIHPIPFAEGTSDEEKKQMAKQRNFLSTLKLKCYYDVLLDDPTYDILTNSCVLLHDYTKQLSQTVIPRQQLQDGLLDVMADCMPFMRTALLNSTGVQGLRVQSQDEQSNVTAASRLIDRAAINGEKYIAIIGNMDFQDLTSGNVAKAEEFLIAMQSLDNFRLSTYGIDNGGLFEKKAHLLQSEQAMNTGSTGIVYQDGLSIRQHFCDVVNSIWDLGIWCDTTESVTGYDLDGDGMAIDEEDQSGIQPGNQPQEVTDDNVA